MRKENTLSILLLLGAVCLLTGCPGPSGSTSGGNGNRTENKEIVDKRTAVVEEAQKKREARLAELKAMDVPRLAQDLETESQTRLEPFNSMTYAEMIRRGKEAATALAPLITKADRSSLFGLLALRQIGPEQYRELKPELRVSILIDALKRSEYFNTWGLPHLSWTDAAKAIVAEGQAAVKPLTELLGDKRPAPVWGGEEYAEYQRYKYRVCDYAWALLNEIGGRKVQIPDDPVARDRLMSEGKP